MNDTILTIITTLAVAHVGVLLMLVRTTSRLDTALTDILRRIDNLERKRHDDK